MEKKLASMQEIYAIEIDTHKFLKSSVNNKQENKMPENKSFQSKESVIKELEKNLSELMKQIDKNQVLILKEQKNCMQFISLSFLV